MKTEKILEKVQTEKGQIYLGLIMMAGIFAIGLIIGMSICKIL